MARKKLIVEPYSKLAAAHKLFATFMKFLIMSKIEVIDKSASTYCFTNPDFLLLCWIYFRLEALQLLNRKLDTLKMNIKLQNKINNRWKNMPL